MLFASFFWAEGSQICARPRDRRRSRTVQTLLLWHAKAWGHANAKSGRWGGHKKAPKKNEVNNKPLKILDLHYDLPFFTKQIEGPQRVRLEFSTFAHPSRCDVFGDRQWLVMRPCLKPNDVNQRMLYQNVPRVLQSQALIYSTRMDA